MDEQEICDLWTMWAYEAGMYEENAIPWMAFLKEWTGCDPTVVPPFPPSPQGYHT
jgi:hypothetical protein